MVVTQVKNQTEKKRSNVPNEMEKKNVIIEDSQKYDAKSPTLSEMILVQIKNTFSEASCTLVGIPAKTLHFVENGIIIQKALTNWSRRKLVAVSLRKCLLYKDNFSTSARILVSKGCMTCFEATSVFQRMVTEVYNTIHNCTSYPRISTMLKQWLQLKSSSRYDFLTFLPSTCWLITKNRERKFLLS